MSVEIIEEGAVEAPVEQPTPAAIEVRNLKRVSATNITCEVLHRDYGWIPFSALKSEVDTNEYAKAVFDHIKTEKVKVSKLEECESVALGAAFSARTWRDEELARADVMINKIEDFEIEGDSKVWRKYRVTLRNWPETKGFPKTKPTAPDSI